MQSPLFTTNNKQQTTNNCPLTTHYIRPNLLHERGADTADFGEIVDRGEGSVLGAVVDDALGEGGSDAGKLVELCGGGGIDGDGFGRE
jgi:hypothetical protein